MKRTDHTTNFGVRSSSSSRPSHWSGRGRSLETDALQLEDRDLKDPRDLDVFLVELTALSTLS